MMVPDGIRIPSFRSRLGREFLIASVLSALLICAAFRAQGRSGFNLADEGYLWYGVQRVMSGGVPIRDFMSYDPGRYYWSAAIMSLRGDNGIVSLRIAAAVFQWIGLTAALICIPRHRPRATLPGMLVPAVILLLWMCPQYKLFDTTISIVLVAVLAFLISKPAPVRFSLAGLTVGEAAVFGRNHGLYGVAGCLEAGVFLAFADRTMPVRKNLGIWAAGVLAGFLPFLVSLATVPNLAAAFCESIRHVFERGATNLALPVPWPWMAHPPDLHRESGSAWQTTFGPISNGSTWHPTSSC